MIMARDAPQPSRQAPRARQSSCAARGCMPAIEPCLKHQYIPEVMLPVAAAGQMLGPAFANGNRVEEAFLPQTLFVEQRFGPVFERTAQPAVERQPEAHLATLDQLARNVTI